MQAMQGSLSPTSTEAEEASIRKDFVALKKRLSLTDVKFIDTLEKNEA